MPFFFRKSFKIGPFRLNLSRSGVGASVGTKGARISTGPRGTYVQTGAMGVYYREKIGEVVQTGGDARAEITSKQPSEVLSDMGTVGAEEQYRNGVVTRAEEIQGWIRDTLVDLNGELGRARTVDDLHLVRQRIEIFISELNLKKGEVELLIRKLRNEFDQHRPSRRYGITRAQITAQRDKYIEPYEMMKIGLDAQINGMHKALVEIERKMKAI